MARFRPPDYLPREVLERQDFIAACRHRDLGAILAIAVKWGGPGFSPSHVARRCEMTISQVQAYIKQQRTAIKLELFEQAADGLHIPGRMLGMARRPWENEETPQSQGDQNSATITKAHVGLPKLVLATPDLGHNVSSEDEDLASVLGRIQKLHRGTVHPEVIRQLHDNALHTVAQYEKLDHSTIVPDLLRQRGLINYLLSECGQPRQQRELYEIAGAMSGVLGYIAVGRGDFLLARAYTLEAFQLGDFAENANLQAWARGLQSFCEYYAGRYGEALSLARDGLNYAQSGPQSVRLAINGAARAMGKLGDAEGVHRTVGEAYELMSRNDVPEGIPSSISFECYSAAQTASNAATAYVSLGRADKVQHYIDLAMPDINNSGSAWSRSLVMIDLALSIVRAKENQEADLDRATELILTALSISAGRPIISVHQRISEFVRDATGRWGNTPQIQAILDAMATRKTR